ncbi:MAG TPA: hypothetical protein VI072_17760 [Polyangiaceae bacterium]
MGLWAGTACDAQVGEDYTGELQFTLAGNVNLDPNSPLVPRLAFFQVGGLALVDGALTGEYPRRFRFEVTKPPPESSLIEIAGIGKIAFGFIALLPPETPSFLPHLSSSASGTYDDAGVLHSTQTDCNAKGSCRIRTLECTEEPCELLAETGDPSLEQNNAYNAAVSQSTADRSQSLVSYCDQARNCYRQYFECKPGTLGEYDTLYQTDVTRCSLLDESGDGSLFDYRDVTLAAQGFQLIYATRAARIGDYGELQKGYNLIEYDLLSREEFLHAPLTCDKDNPARCEWPERARVIEGEEVNIDLVPPPAP